jgi:catechol 2,3-dioxygenase-like lactoylglutathione lyase family enzyme
MTHPFTTARIHHVAYRCKDAKETVDWYARVLGFTYTTAFAEDHVPSTGEYDPYDGPRSCNASMGAAFGI